jgi:formylglycine-generating enzyme required for sulfatase activity
MKAFAAVVCLLTFLACFYVGSPLLALMRYGDLAPEVRTAMLERDLTGLHSGVATLLPSGAMALVRKSDVVSIGESRCTRDYDCISGRRSCTRTFVAFACGYGITLRDGRDASAYLEITTTIGLLPDFSPVTVDDFQGDGSGMDEAAGFLCKNGFGCTKTIVPAPPLRPDPRAFTDCQDNFCGPEMLRLPQGKFKRGSTMEEQHRNAADKAAGGGISAEETEGPVAEVSIAYPLAMGRFEVTVAEWLACVNDKACPEETRPAGIFEPRQPVVYVTWTDVTQHYLPWLNGKLRLSGAHAYRLPSEAEWEYAARAGTTTQYTSGDFLDNHAAVFSTQSAGPVLVGSYPPNAFGLYDTAGNADELVQDCYAHGHLKSPVNGAAYDPPDCSSSRVAKGGSWRELPVYLRPAHRSLVDATKRYTETGFRLARTLPQP